MFSTAFLLTLAIYVYAVVGTEIITKDIVLRSHSEEVADIINNDFCSLWATMLTLFRFVTLDSVSSLYTPLIKAKPPLILYFVSILLLISISLMNLVMAVIVEGALKMAAEDKEMERIKERRLITSLTPKIHDTFAKLDRDGSGSITIDEVKRASISDFPAEMQELMQLDSLVEFLNLMDVDGSREVTQDELVSGVLCLALAE